MKDDESDDKNKVINLDEYRKADQETEEVHDFYIDELTRGHLDEIVGFFDVRSYSSAVHLATSILSVLISELKKDEDVYVVFNHTDKKFLRMEPLYLPTNNELEDETADTDKDKKDT